MKKVVLRFPSHLSIVNFVLSQKPTNAEVNSLEQTLIASLSKDDIKLATEGYGAFPMAIASSISYENSSFSQCFSE
jgi:hypothetical protein